MDKLSDYPRQFRASKSHGFTLVELMVTLSILAILATLAVPSFTSTINSIRLSGATNDLSASIQQARNDAIRLGRRVTICATANGTTCSGTATWKSGWITFLDTPGVSSTPSIGAKSVTVVAQPMPDNIEIIPTTTESYISFSADGVPRNLNASGGAAFNFTLRICNTSPSLTDESRARDLVINAIGRIDRRNPSSAVASTCPAPPSLTAANS
jgi:type IV fimbrial biogenesis protein FimT